MRQQHIPYGPYEKYMKRPLDFIISLSALFVLSPILAITALMVMVKLGRPVVFAQKRPGMIDKETGQEKIFTMYKFRSMSDQRSKDGQLLPDKDRLTAFGKALRASSLDELLELWNVVKGDMSLIGPRPLSVLYLPYYTETERRRHEVRPGITGLAQVNGRNAVSWEFKFSKDIEYVDNITFMNDLKIIAETIKAVVKRENTGQGSEAPISLHILRQQERVINDHQI